MLCVAFGWLVGFGRILVLDCLCGILVWGGFGWRFAVVFRLGWVCCGIDFRGSGWVFLDLPACVVVLMRLAGLFEVGWMLLVLGGLVVLGSFWFGLWLVSVGFRVF